jgi:hypothetical protein
MNRRIFFAALLVAATGLTFVSEANADWRSAYSGNRYPGAFAGGLSYYNRYTGGYYSAGARFNHYTDNYAPGRQYYNPYINTYGQATAVFNPYTGRYAYGFDRSHP